jgi:hypothetical protein
MNRVLKELAPLIVPLVATMLSSLVLYFTHHKQLARMVSLTGYGVSPILCIVYMWNEERKREKRRQTQQMIRKILND